MQPIKTGFVPRSWVKPSAPAQPGAVAPTVAPTPPPAVAAPLVPPPPPAVSTPPDAAVDLANLLAGQQPQLAQLTTPPPAEFLLDLPAPLAAFQLDVEPPALEAFEAADAAFDISYQDRILATVRRGDGDQLMIHSPEPSVRMTHGRTTDTTEAGITFRLNDGAPVETGVLTDGMTVHIAIKDNPQRFFFIWRAPQRTVPAPEPDLGPPPPPPAPIVDVGTVHAKLLPSNDILTSASFLPPSDVAHRIQALRVVNPHMVAAAVSDGRQGAILTPSGYGITMRGDSAITENNQGIAYALAIPSDVTTAPIEVQMVVDGQSSHLGPLGPMDRLAMNDTIETVLATVAQYTGTHSASTTSDLQTIVDLVGEGLAHAHRVVRSGIATVSAQVIVKQGNQIRMLWAGNATGFTIAEHGYVLHAYDGETYLTPPDFQPTPSNPVFSERGFLLSPNRARTRAVGLDETFQPNMAERTFTAGGWYGAASVNVLGTIFGLGNVREAIQAAPSQRPAVAVVSLLQKATDASAQQKALPIKGADRKTVEQRAVQRGNWSLFVSRHDRADERLKQRHAAQQKLRAAGYLKNAADAQALEKVSTDRKLMAAALISNRYNNPEGIAVIRTLLGLPVVPAPTP